MNVVETDKKSANLDIEMTNEEYENLFHYGISNISDKKRKELIVEWAILNILEKKCEKNFQKPFDKTC